ncbi:hypothetical protein [Halomonas sp.]|uniref:hypothetical protein n=1 Tax=Halomonas sp. TaxID=1486246 RepID=UPI0035637C79
MVDWNIATGAEGPINRTGHPNTQVVGEDVQGTLVGYQDNGGVAELVEANAVTGVAVPALGVLLQEQVIDLATIPTGSYLQDLEEQLVQENKTLKDDRGTFVFNGIEMVNNDDDTSFNYGEPVYLAEGGGFTQTKPADAGDIVQCVGMCIPPNEDAGIGTEQGDRILLDVDWDYTTV